MLGLVLIYFVGKAFYDLAGLHNKSQWGFGILGVVSYYGGLIVSEFIIVILLEIYNPDFVANTSETVLGIMGIPFGVLSCWLTYFLLKRTWSAPKILDNKGALDAGLINYKKDER